VENETLDEIGNALASGAGSLFNAIYTSASNEIELTHTSALPFTVTPNVAAAVPNGAMVTDAGSTASHYKQLTITPTGGVQVGETWRLSVTSLGAAVNDGGHTYDYVVQDADGDSDVDLQDVAAGWQALMDADRLAGYISLSGVSHAGGDLTLTHADGMRAPAQRNWMSFHGDVFEGETWQITVDPGGRTDTYTGVAEDLNGDHIVDAFDVAEDFRLALAGDSDRVWDHVSVTADGRLVLSHDSAASLGATQFDGVTAAPVDGDAVVSGTLPAAWQQSLVLALSDGDINGGDLWTVLLTDGSELSYSVSGSENLDGSIAGLNTAFAGRANTDSEVANGAVIFEDHDGSAVDVAQVTFLRHVPLPLDDIDHVGSALAAHVDISDDYRVDYVHGNKTLTIESSSSFTAAFTVGGSGSVSIDPADGAGTTVVIDLTGASVAALGEVWELNLTPQAADAVGKQIAYVTKPESFVLDPREHYEDVAFKFDPETAVVPSDVWTVIVNDLEYSFAVPLPSEWGPESRLVSKMAEQIAMKISEAGGMTYTAAHDLENDPTILNIVDKDLDLTGPGQTLTASARRGEGGVKGIFDIDAANVIRGVDQFRRVKPLYWWGFKVGETIVSEYYPYTDSVYFEVCEKESAKCTSGAKTGKKDVGSTEDDLFLNHTFTSPGSYVIRVGTYRDYENQRRFKDDWRGVEKGLSYQLNVSLDEHASNENQIALVNKLVKVVEGTGAGNTAEIFDYDAETKTFTIEHVDELWSLSEDSVFVVYEDVTSTLDVQPWVDGYTLSLSRPPAGNLVIDVKPEVTRTYNSALAFDPAANFGAGLATQVEVATRQVTVELQGTPAEYEEWILSLNDEDFTYTVNNGDTLNDVASELASVITSTAGNSAYGAVVDGTVITIDAAGSFFATFTTNAVIGQAEVSGTRTKEVGAFHWEDAEIQLSGGAASGETWELNLDGNKFIVDVDAGVITSVADIGEQLVANIVAANILPEYEIAYDPNETKVTITQLNSSSVGKGFTAELVVTKGSAVITPQVVFDASNWNSPQEVLVRAVDDDVLEGRDALVFPAMQERVVDIRGPLHFDGGLQLNGDRFLNHPFTLPNETNFPVPDGFLTGFGWWSDPDQSGAEYPTLSDALATHILPGTGENPGFDPRINDFPYSFTFLDGIYAGTTVRALKRHPNLDKPDTVILERFIQRGDPEPFFASQKQWRIAEINLSGLSVNAAGELWSVTLDENTFTYTTAAADVDLIDHVGVGLRDAVTGSYESQYDSDTNVLTLRAADSHFMEVAFGVGGAGVAVIQGEGNVDHYYYAPVNPNTLVNEQTQVDTLNLYHGESLSNDIGVLTENDISGLGMGPDTYIGDRWLPGGIRYDNLESVRIELGSGADDFTIASTHAGATTVLTGAGDDHVDVQTIAGNTSVHTEAGSDTVDVSSQQQFIDEIAALLTVDGGSVAEAPGAGDQLLLDDSQDARAEFGTMTENTLTGLGMPSVAEVQLVTVQAQVGTFSLAWSGTADGVTSTTHGCAFTVRGGQVGVFTYEEGQGDDIEAYLNGLLDLGTGDDPTITVMEHVEVRNRQMRSIGYTVTFGGELAGCDMAEIVWADKAASQLIGYTGASAGVEVKELHQGALDAGMNTVQTLEFVNPDEIFDFTLTILNEPLTVSSDATEVEVFDVLTPVLNPNNLAPNLPHTNNFNVARHDNVLQLTFQGEHRNYRLDCATDIAPAAVLDKIACNTRLEGVNYYSFEEIDITLGDGGNTFNVQGTDHDALTNLDTGEGADRIYVSSDAAGDHNDTSQSHGDLAQIRGTLNIEAGGGVNALYVSDFDSTAADAKIEIFNNAIQGFLPGATGSMTYTATGGTFEDGLVYWAGQGSDRMVIHSVRQQGLEQTVIYPNHGDDTLVVKAADLIVETATSTGASHQPLQDAWGDPNARRLRIHADVGNDLIDASLASLAVWVSAGDGNDIVVGGSGPDVLYGNGQDDLLLGGGASDIIFGGDPTSSSHANDILLGDHGLVVFEACDTTSPQEPWIVTYLSSRMPQMPVTSSNSSTWVPVQSDLGGGAYYCASDVRLAQLSTSIHQEK
ncbi:MAG: hypothetical protein MK136_17440, partial [Pirellulaceae bacterium]|nr:hypothetical protein [Pirellulaceae bacterium]